MSDDRILISVEDALILSHDIFEGGQHVMRLQAPKCARKALPGSFVHIRCEPLLEMRRPISLMRVDPEAGWVEILFKELGKGTALLAQREEGETVNMMGPIGNPFRLSDGKTRPLLIGGGVGIPPMVFLADAIRRRQGSLKPLVLMGSELPFPFEMVDSTQEVGGVERECSKGMALVESWGVPVRLASNSGFTGCFNGFVTDLARNHLRSLSDEALAQVEVFSCGPHPMLSAVSAVAEEFGLPCQLSLEEYMACAVGGCAGCVVKVKTDQGEAMKRVCVDGPVFDAASLSF